jgi:hypothetical protein
MPRAPYCYCTLGFDFCIRRGQRVLDGRSGQVAEFVGLQAPGAGQAGVPAGSGSEVVDFTGGRKS